MLIRSSTSYDVLCLSPVGSVSMEALQEWLTQKLPDETYFSWFDTTTLGHSSSE